MRYVILPYRMPSVSARLLRDELTGRGLDCRRVFADGRYQPRRSDIIINWGHASFPTWYRQNLAVINNPDNVAAASNKLIALTKMQRIDSSIQIPDFTSQVRTAHEWYRSGATVVCRELLRASGGRGITILKPERGSLLTGEQFIEATSGCRMFTKYIKKISEYRVHVFNNSVISVQEKRRSLDFQGVVDNQIRNHDRGWVFCRENVNVNDAAKEISKRAVLALGLNFGAVDIIYNRHYGQHYVLEVNTAPGLQGASLVAYGDAIQVLEDTIENQRRG